MRSNFCLLSSFILIRIAQYVFDLVFFHDSFLLSVYHAIFSLPACYWLYFSLCFWFSHYKFIRLRTLPPYLHVRNSDFLRRSSHFLSWKLNFLGFLAVGFGICFLENIFNERRLFLSIWFEKLLFSFLSSSPHHFARACFFEYLDSFLHEYFCASFDLVWLCIDLALLTFFYSFSSVRFQYMLSFTFVRKLNCTCSDPSSPFK